MEQSQLVSSVIAKLKIAYQYYFKDLTDEEFLGLVNMYQEQLVGYRPQVILKTVNDIISKSKFMPTVAEILENCKYNENNYKNVIIEKMKADGYFKDPREIEKTYKFLEEGIIPHWLLEDMKKYGYVDYKKAITTSTKDIKQLGSGEIEFI